MILARGRRRPESILENSNIPAVVDRKNWFKKDGVFGENGFFLGEADLVLAKYSAFKMLRLSYHIYGQPLRKIIQAGAEKLASEMPTGKHRWILETSHVGLIACHFLQDD